MDHLILLVLVSLIDTHFAKDCPTKPPQMWSKMCSHFSTLYHDLKLCIPSLFFCIKKERQTSYETFIGHSEKI